jgi:cation:H+ antiporter
LTGLAWPLIYFTAAFFHRRKYRKPLREIALEEEHCVEVMGLLAPLIYIAFVWWKRSLDLWDAGVLILIYVAYIGVLSRMPPQHHEGIEDLDRIPRAVVKARRPIRNAAIFGLFLVGGGIIYFVAEPFLGSLLAVSTALGISHFVFIQWVAPFVSEFPEKVSAFYWASTIDRASIALMNMVSSNINQWTLLAAMLPIVFSISRGAPSEIPFDDQQSLEILMTLGQSLVGMLFLINMRLKWWEAGALFSLWFVQFIFSPFQPGPGIVGFLAEHIHGYVTVVYLVWFAAGMTAYALRPGTAHAFHLFAKMWRTYVRRQQAVLK